LDDVLKTNTTSFFWNTILEWGWSGLCEVNNLQF
jgi:hypothetical protein